MKRVFIISLLVLVVFLIACSSSPSGDYDAFAQCLTDNGVKMFGAYWCPHCQNQEKMFGDSWEKVNYIECSLPGGQGQTAFCEQQGITGYPTWEFGDGSRVPGEISLEELSGKSGCSLA